jgi:hypothetical protein
MIEGYDRREDLRFCSLLVTIYVYTLCFFTAIEPAAPRKAQSLMALQTSFLDPSGTFVTPPHLTLKGNVFTVEIKRVR